MTSEIGERSRRELLTPLLVALAVILALAYWVFRPFFLVFAVAGCVALLLSPLQKRLARLLGGRSSLAAALLVLVTTVLILMPVLSSLLVLAQETSTLLDWLKAQPLGSPDTVRRFWQALPQRYPSVRPWVVWVDAQVAPALEAWVAQIAGAVSGILQGLLARVTLAVLDLVLFLLMLFFLLRDGGRLRSELRPISPFSADQERQIFEHLESTIKGALQAMIVVPVVQGILAGIGFMVFGVPSPFVWGTAVMIAATVPIVGSPLGWLPACFYLFANGSTAAGVGLSLFCLLIVSGSDNVVKPLLLRGAARIHPLLGFLSILGGVLAFGVFGFLIGPVVLSLVISAIRIYRLDVLRHPPSLAASASPASGAASTT